MVEYRKQEDRQDIYDLCVSTHPLREKGFLDFYFSHLYEQGRGLVVKGNNHVVSTLQLHEHILSFLEKKLLCNYISGVSTHLDYRKQGLMNELFQTALDISNNNYLISFVEAYNPKLYKKYGFETISYRKKFSVSQKDLKVKNTSGVETTFEVSDLIALYQKFSNRFDCYYVRDEEYYNNYLDNIHMNKGNVIAYYEGEELVGYCVYYEFDDRIEVSEILYLNSISLVKMLKYAIGYAPYISFEVSANEKVEKIFKMSIPRKHTCVMARINNYTLFNKLYSCKVKTVEEAFSILKKPTLMNEKY